MKQEIQFPPNYSNYTKSGSSRTPVKRKANPLDFSQIAIPVGLLTGLLLLLASESPQLPRSIRIPLIQAGSLWLLTLAALSSPPLQELKRIFREGIAPLLIIFLGWCLFMGAIAPYRGFAVFEILRIFDGAAVFFITAYGMRRPKETLYTILGLLGMGVALCLYDFLTISEGNGLIGLRSNVFGTHENFGSLVMLMFPLTLLFAISSETDDRIRTAGLIATPIVSGGLLLSLTRSAWIGGAAALIALALLLLRVHLTNQKPSKTSKTQKRSLSAFLGSPGFLISLALIGLVIAGGIGTVLSQRAITITEAHTDSSFTDRLRKWRGACQMTAEKPLTGWGLGSYMVIQQRWTNQGDSEAKTLSQGTDHQNIAHNYYVQWAADSGGVGVALYVALIMTFLILAIQSLAQFKTASISRALLIGCIATVFGAAIDAIGAPSYNFHGVSSVFWLFLGTGVAVMREKQVFSSPDVLSGSGEPSPSTGIAYLAGAGIGLTVAIIIIVAGRM